MTDSKTTTLKGEFITYNSWEEEARHTHTQTHTPPSPHSMWSHVGKHHGQLWDGRNREEGMATAFIVFFVGRNEWSKVGKLTKFRIG